MDHYGDQPGAQPQSIMAPLVEALTRQNKRLEERVDSLLIEREKLKLRIWDLEDQLYRNSRATIVRDKFDSESA